MSARDSVYSLLDAAAALPRGAAQIAICEQAALAADACDDVALGYEARQALVDAAQFGGRPDVSLVAFAWCVAQFDAHPDEFDAYDLLWRFKWVVNTISRFPHISRPKIEEMLGEMERRYIAVGSSLQPVWEKRRSVCLRLGDLEGAADAHRRGGRMGRSFLSDCHACEIDSLADYWFELGKDSQGLKVSERIFQNNMSCAEVPHGTYASRLLPLLKAGRGEEGMAAHRKGYRMIQGNPEFAAACAEHMAFLALTGNDAKALRLLERHVADGLDEVDPYRSFEFCRLAWLALDVLAERKAKASLRLPRLTTVIAGPGEYDLSALAEEFHACMAALAQRFDARNGNDYVSRFGTAAKRWKKHAIRIPLGS